MGRGSASRSRDQYEPVEDRKRRRCSCFYGFLVFVTIVVLLAIIGGAAFAGWLLYNLRAEEGAVTYTYDESVNGTESVYGEQEEGVSGGDIQYAKIVPYDPSKDKYNEDDVTPDDTAGATMAAPPATLAATTLGTASRLLGADEHQNGLHKSTTPVVKVSDEELEEISRSLWTLSQPMLQEGVNYKMALGERVNATIRADLSAETLFSDVQPLGHQSETFTTFLRLLDNYNYIVQVPETYNEADTREINDFLDALVTTPTMQRLQQFLVGKGAASSDTAAFKQQLWGIWFRLYNRSPKYDIMDSSGFEHVFVGEIRKNKVIGFHSWVQFYLQEHTGQLNYHGYYSHVTPRMISIRLKWHEKTLRMTSFFVGTPPEYDVAIYTLCVLTRPGEACPVNVGDNRVNVRTLEVKHIEGVQIADAFIAI